MFGSDQQFGSGASTGFYPQTLDQSLRFEDGDSAYLNFQDSGDSDSLTTFTFSFWVKRGNLGSDTRLFVTQMVASDYAGIDMKFTSADQLFLREYSGVGGYYWGFTTSQVFRDPSAWYHIVLAVDTTQATAADRAKLYINGEQVSDANLFQSSSAATKYPTLNFEDRIAKQSNKNISHPSAEFFDGYMAEWHYCDGTQYTADDFGELKSGIWVPKEVDVTYGTNGFYLDFADSAAIGDDESGNGNDWTVNNLVASDVVPDSPTNNFAVCNAVEKGSSITLAEGNLKVTNGANQSWQATASTVSVSSGKWYCEVRVNAANQVALGIAESSLNVQRTPAIWETAQGYSYFSNTGDVRHNNASTSYGGATYTAGDIISIALDLDAGTLVFYKNGASQGNAATGLTGEWKFVFAYYTTNDSGTSNFGQDSTFHGNETAGGNSDANGIGDFKYTVPSGYLALCTSNLPNPAIDPAQDDVPEDYFDVLTYTGDGSASREINGLTFQPDWVWFKGRSAARHSKLYDVVRGATFSLSSSETNAEATDTDGLLSFDADGFTIGDKNNINENTKTFVAWNWKAGGTASTIAVGDIDGTNPTIAADVSANTDAGFSIVAYTGNGSASQTVPTGLNQPAEMIITKRRTGTARGWAVYHHKNTSAPATDYLQLHLTNATVDNDAFWDDTLPDTEFYTVDTSVTVNDNGDDHIAYCFHSVDGFSKVGSYEGNNSTDGTFVFTNFRPKWVLIKHADSTGNWTIFDAERSTYNLVDDQLLTNSSNAEKVQAGVDFLSNGFKLRVSGVADFNNTDTYIYLAFAEQPFKYSNAR